MYFLRTKYLNLNNIDMTRFRQIYNSVNIELKIIKCYIGFNLIFTLSDCLYSQWLNPWFYRKPAVNMFFTLVFLYSVKLKLQLLI